MKGEDQQWLPPGFRFTPTDKELVSWYLKRKVKRSSSSSCSIDDDNDDDDDDSCYIVDFDIYSCDPWQLPRHLFDYPTGERKEMYFFTPTHPPSNCSSSSSSSKRCGRNAGCGVWHGNGKDQLIKNWDEATGRYVVVGHKTSFNFEKFIKSDASAESSSKRVKTGWLMYEYRLHSVVADDHKRGLVLSKIFEKPTSNGIKDCSGWLPDKFQLPHLKRKRAAAATPPAPCSPDTPLHIQWEDAQSASAASGEQQSQSADLIEEEENQSTLVPMKRRRVVEQPEHEDASSYNSWIDQDSDTDELIASIDFEALDACMSSLEELIGNAEQVQSPVALQAAGINISDVAYPDLPLAMSDAAESTDVAVVPVDDLSPLEDDWWADLGSIHPSTTSTSSSCFDSLLSIESWPLEEDAGFLVPLA